MCRFTILALGLLAVLGSAGAQTLSDAAQQLGNLTSLSATLTALNVTVGPDFQGILLGPSDAAFANAPSLNAANTTQLQDIMSYHVLPGPAQLPNTAAVRPTALPGQNLTIDVTNSTAGSGQEYYFFSTAGDPGRCNNTDCVPFNNGSALLCKIDAVLMPPNSTIVQYLQSNPDLSLLLGLITNYSLAPLFDDAAVTLFAPNNAAVQQFLSTANLSSDPQTQQAQVTYVLLGHVLNNPVPFSFAQATPGQTYTFPTYINSQLGQDVQFLNITPAADGGNNTVTSIVYGTPTTPATVIAADQNAGKSYVNVIDSVLETGTFGPPSNSTNSTGGPPPPTPAPAPAATGGVADVATALGLSSLISTLTALNLTDALGPDFQGVVLGPSDDAFANATLDTSNTTQLQNIISYHVLPGAPTLPVTADVRPTALQGQNLTIGVVNTTSGQDYYFYSTASDGGHCNNTDCQPFNNGSALLCKIDTVLMPPNSTIVQYLQGNPDLSLLLGLITNYSLASVFDDAAVTLLAPNNAAIEAFLSTANLSSDPQTQQAQVAYVIFGHVLNSPVPFSFAQANPGQAYTFPTYINSQLGSDVQFLNITPAAGNGNSTVVSIVNGVPTTTANVIAADQNGGKSYVDVIDTVLDTGVFNATDLQPFEESSSESSAGMEPSAEVPIGMSPGTTSPPPGFFTSPPNFFQSPAPGQSPGGPAPGPRGGSASKAVFTAPLGILLAAVLLLVHA